MKRAILPILILALLPHALSAETFFCEGTNISIQTNQPANAELACAAVARAKAQFARCNIPPPATPLRIEIARDLKPGCVGLYHCGKGLIETLEPATMQSRREPDSAFAFMDIDAYFQSVIIHEMTHAALDRAPCPFRDCNVAHEYLAYVMQISAMSPENQAKFAASAPQQDRVSRDELSAAILLMAPHVFARKAWAHFSQRDDPCGFVGQIVDGTVLLDRERFDF